MAMLCDFHHVYKTYISQIRGPTAEAALQKSWDVVLEEALGGRQVQSSTYTEVSISGLDQKNREV